MDSWTRGILVSGGVYGMGTVNLPHLKPGKPSPSNEIVHDGIGDGTLKVFLP